MTGVDAELFKCLRNLRLLLSDSAKLYAMSKAAGLAAVREVLSRDGKVGAKAKAALRNEERKLRRNIAEAHKQWECLRRGFLGLPEIEQNEKDTVQDWLGGEFGGFSGDGDNDDDDGGGGEHAAAAAAAAADGGEKELNEAIIKTGCA